MNNIVELKNFHGSSDADEAKAYSLAILAEAAKRIESGEVTNLLLIQVTPEIADWRMNLSTFDIPNIYVIIGVLEMCKADLMAEMFAVQEDYDDE